MVEWTGFENRRGVSPYREFESRPLRHFQFHFLAHRSFVLL